MSSTRVAADAATGGSCSLCHHGLAVRLLLLLPLQRHRPHPHRLSLLRRPYMLHATATLLLHITFPQACTLLHICLRRRRRNDGAGEEEVGLIASSMARPTRAAGTVLTSRSTTAKATTWITARTTTSTITVTCSRPATTISISNDIDKDDRCWYMYMYDLCRSIDRHLQCRNNC